MKTVLDYNCFSRNILSVFYPIVDTRENITKNKYDIIICTRDNIQDEFMEISQFANDSAKVIVDLVTESGCLDDFINQFDIISKNYKNLNFYVLVDGIFDYKFSDNVKVLSSLKLSLLAFFENFFQKNHNQQYTIERFDLYNKENGITSLNGRLRMHRILLLLELLKRNSLFKEMNHISFLLYNSDKFDEEFYLDYINGILDKKDITLEEYNILTGFTKHLPMSVNGESGNAPNTTIHGISFNKILNLVTENVVELECGDNKHNTITVTEKAWIPLRIHQIPVYISKRGYVNQLRKLGFDLFDDIVDHSYDDELDPKRRIKLAVDEVERLQKIDLLSFYNKNYSRFVKNNILCQLIKGEAFEILSNFILENDLV
jgi:hypothetical protein